jgi:farnesyl diphosphate synthase
MTSPIIASMENQAFTQWLADMQLRAEAVLAQHLPAASIIPQRLHEAMRYATLGGGKRVRALLAYAAAEFCNADITKADVAAGAVELIHAFSLVHDDMPCMDDDDLRRGKPSTHKQYDDATALLVGDALQSLAFQLIAQCSHIEDAYKIKMVQVLAIATGSRGMAGGQAIDLENTGLVVSQAELEVMHLHKTGALIHAATLMGAYCSAAENPDKLHAVDHFSKSIGLAFQVVDDILDAEADTQTLGKTAGKDAQANKSTYVTLLGLSKAKQLAAELYHHAINALSSYGQEADLLRHLAHFITQRSF